MFDVVNNTIFANAAVFGGGLAANASNITLANNILFSNTATQEDDDLYLVQGAFNNLEVRSNIIGDGHFEDDPRRFDGNGDQLAEVDVGADEAVPEPSATLSGLVAAVTILALNRRRSRAALNRPVSEFAPGKQRGSG